jgi:transposase
MATMPANKVVSIDAFREASPCAEYGASRMVSRKPIERQRFALSESERKQLERWAHGRTTPLRLALRSRIVLLAASGLSLRQVAAAARTSLRTVVLWKGRFIERGMQSLLHDAPGRGRKPAIARDIVRAIDAERTAAAGAGRTPTVRAVALKFGVSRSTVHRIWNDATSRDRHNSGTTR